MKKMQRKEFCGNIIDEILEIFPLKSLKLYNDTLNYSNKFVLKYLTDQKNQKITHLELRNLVISDNFHFLENLKQFTCLKVINLDLSVKCLDLVTFLKLLDQLTIKSVNTVIINFYFEDYKIDLNETKLDEAKKIILDKLNIYELKLNFIKSNFNENPIIKQNKLDNEYSTDIFVFYLFYKYLPEFIHIKFSEIVERDNQHMYSYLSYKLSYKFFCLTNALKNIISSRTKVNKGNLCVNLRPNFFALLFGFLSDNDKLNSLVFEKNFQSLQMKIPTKKKDDNNPINSMRVVYNLTQDYESVMIRKIKYEKIFQLMSTKPENNANSDSLLNKIKLKNFDLNSFTKIVSKLSGYQMVFLPDGRTFIIGGSLKSTDNEGKPIITPLNSILVIDYKISAIDIYTFNDNYFLSHFNAASLLLSPNEILIVGGISNSTLLLNFKTSPVYVISVSVNSNDNVNDISIKRIWHDNDLMKQQCFPGVIFMHKIEMKNITTIVVKDGFCIENYNDGISILPENTSKDLKKEEPKAKPVRNTHIYEFDLEKRLWSKIK